MILLLLAMLLAAAVTGWLQGLELFWGESLIQDLHENMASVLMASVILHIAVVLVIQKKQLYRW